jgi:single-stranded-DNA-specific exonuclease
MPNNWTIAAPHASHRDLAEQMRISPLAAQVLCNRGLSDLEQAKTFFDPKLSDLLPPSALEGTEQAADLVREAIQQGRKIVIYGDYDVDGITGTATLWRVLRMAGADVDYYIPHRLEEGYGLNEEAVRQIVADGAGLIITVDCGITACEPIRAAKDLGAKVILTDHHGVRPELPCADVIIHPTVSNYACPHLSGAGVAMKLAWAIAQRFSPGARVTQEFRDFLLDATSLAALGTIADVVPLVGENRILAKYGLLGLANSKNTGICALLAAAKLTDQKLQSDHVGYWLAPRLNAAGRLGHAGLCVEMLTKADATRAMEIATYLEEQNKQRQTIEKQITTLARQMVIDRGMDRDDYRAIVLAGEGWHAGVIGIVASRLVDEFGKPTVLVTFDPADPERMGQGSARSISGFVLDQALACCSKHLTGFGGHAMAAGLKVHRDNFQKFAEAFFVCAGERLRPEDLVKTLSLDAEADLGQVTPNLIAELNRLAPFGQGNPKPKFASGWLRLAGSPKIVGRNQDHLQMNVTDGRNARKAVAFGMAKRLSSILEKGQFRLAFEAMANEWNGRVSAELRVIDIEVCK